MMRPKAVITIGVPGCGKTRHADRLVAQGFVNVNLDDCRALVSGDASNQACTPAAVKEHGNQIDVAIVSAQNVVVSDTNLNGHFRGLLADKFRAAGYHVTFVVFFIPFRTCVARNAARDRVVPLDAMERMQTAFEQTVQGPFDKDVDGLVFIGLADQEVAA